MEPELESMEDMELIDAGIEPDDEIGPEFLCCWGPYTPYRM